MDEFINDAIPEQEDPDIISVVDENGNEFLFEELDSFFEGENEYVAVASIETEEDVADADGEMIVLQRVYEDDDIYLAPIEDEETLLRIGNIFIDRLSDQFDFDEP